MPYYDYKCTICGHTIKDHRKGLNEPHLTACDKCYNESLEQTFEEHNSLVQYKGKCWFKTGGKY